LIENVSLYSPLIIVIGILLCSLFSANIAKGATFVVCAIIATSLRDTLLKMNNSPSITNPMAGGGKKHTMRGGSLGKCDMGIKIFGDDSTLGIYILMFSMSYICAPMFIIGHINFYVLIFFIFYIISDVFIRSTNGCFQGAKQWTAMVTNGIGGAALGTVISTLIYSYQNNWSYVNITSSNKEVCSMPTKQTFKCGVYKNGELLASTGGA
jgi:hypothetical protein